MKTIRTLLFIFLSGMIPGCATDYETQQPEPSAGTDLEIHINLDLYGALSPRRSGEEEQEGDTQTSQPTEIEIENAVVMLFLPASDLEPATPGKLWKTVKASSPQHIADNRYTLDIRFGIDPETVPESLVAVILANGLPFHTLLSSLEGRTYAEVRRELSQPISSRPLSEGFDSPRDFSMWGIGTRRIDTSLISQSLRASLLRDLARTSVVLDADLADSQGHALAALLLYNRTDDISILPAIDEEGTHILPSVPYGAAKTEKPEYRIFPLESAVRSLSQFHPEQDILMGSDSGEPGDENRFNRAAVIVGLYWKGTERLYYYRLDYMDGERLIDVKRNHHYLINIVAVNGPGADTPEEAYNTISSSIQATVTPWEDINNDVALDGDNWIAMARTVTLGSDAGAEASLQFLTNVSPELWEMAWREGDQPTDDLEFTSHESLDDPSGTFSVTKGETLQFKTLSSLPANLDMRTKQLYINVTPRLRLVVNVVQSRKSSSSGMTDWNDQNIFDEI